MKAAMNGVASRNFHLPMPSRLYQDLRAEAMRRGVPATALARQVLEEWLEARHRQAVAEAIATYAVGVAGGAEDLDAELEALAVSEMLKDPE
jgi:hypothetical protein